MPKYYLKMKTYYNPRRLNFINADAIRITDDEYRFFKKSGIYKILDTVVPRDSVESMQVVFDNGAVANLTGGKRAKV